MQTAPTRRVPHRLAAAVQPRKLLHLRLELPRVPYLPTLAIIPPLW